MTQPETQPAASTTAAQESIRDLVKLLISLASTVIVLSATFTEKLALGIRYGILVLFLAWIALSISVVCGVMALSKLAHAQWTSAAKWGDMTFPLMRSSWKAFVAGMVLLLVYGAIAASMQAWRKVESAPAPAVSCIEGKPGPPGPPGPRGEQGIPGVSVVSPGTSGSVRALELEPPLRDH